MNYFFRLLRFASILLLVPWEGCDQKREPTQQLDAVTIVFMGAGPRTEEEARTDDRVLSEFTRQTGIAVRLIPGPESATDRLQLYMRFIENSSSTPDVYLIDVVWPGVLAEHLVDLNRYLSDEAKQQLPVLLDNDTVAGRLVAMPYDVETGLLFYRADLLRKYGFAHPPETWEELDQMATHIQAGERAAGNPNFWGYVWQGARYEGLTCNALEWQVSQGGGKIVEPDGFVSVNNVHTVEALKRAKSWIGRISPPGVVEFTEGDSRNAWNSGNAAFMRDWSWWVPNLLGDPGHSVMPTAAFTALPRGRVGRAAVVGGFSLAVSKYSLHPREAVALVRYLTSRDVQFLYWNETGMMSTRSDFYANVGQLRSGSQIGQMESIFAHDAVARPSTVAGRHYDLVSRAYFSAVHSVLVGNATPEKALAQLQEELLQITGLHSTRAPGNRNAEAP